MNNGTQPHSDDAENVWTQPRFVASAVVVGLIVVLGIVLVITGGNGDSTAATPPAESPPAAKAPAASEGCDLPAGDQAVPQETPAGTRWELVGKMIAPTAPKTYGPAVVKDGFRTCFAHSPMGALYATVNFWATGTEKPAAEVLRKLAAPSAARDKGIRASLGDDEPALARTSSLQVAGFSFSSYSRSRAGIKLAVRAENGRLAQIDTTMLWTRGDWRYEVPLDQRPPTSPLNDLSAFIAWKGA
jgi:hypothetical protein